MGIECKQMISIDMKDQYRSPEEVGINIRVAGSEDKKPLKDFLSRSEIDSLFIPSLSDPIRGMTIDERVDKKFKEGVWVIAAHEGTVVGCMAIVPSKLPLDVPPQNPNMRGDISEGVSFREWGVEKIMELRAGFSPIQKKESLLFL